MSRATMSVRVAAVFLMMLLLLATTATATAAARRDLLEEAAPAMGLSKEEPPSGHLPYRVVKGLIEKATGKSARVDLEKQKDEKEQPLMSIP